MRLRDALTDPGGGLSNSTGLFDEPGWGLDLLVQCYFDPGPAAGEGSRASQRVLDRGRIPAAAARRGGGSRPITNVVLSEEARIRSPRSSSGWHVSEHGCR